MKRINILPKELILEQRYKNSKIYYIKEHFLVLIFVVLFVEVSLFGFTHLVRNVVINMRETSFQKIKKEINLLAVKLENEGDLLSRIDENIKTKDKLIHQVEEKVKYLERQRNKPRGYSRILAEINNECPRKIWMTLLELKDNGLKIVGGSYSILLVAQFMDNLQESSYFEAANFSYTRKGEIEKVEVVEFEITCKVVRTGDRL